MIFKLLGSVWFERLWLGLMKKIKSKLENIYFQTEDNKIKLFL